MKLVISTTNKNKIIEIKDKFHSLGNLEILSLSDFGIFPNVNEDGNTFEENAFKKARVYSSFTGLTVLSDDSGLVIDALGGEPGVNSHRYAGNDATDDENNDLVLKKLEKVPDENRSARFVCLIAIVQPSGDEFTAKGVCEGRIIRKKIGSNGFGYDPIFYIPHLGKTMAELSIHEKNQISHRAIALDKAKEILKKL